MIRDSERRDAANIIKELSSASPQWATYIKKLRANSLNLANNMHAYKSEEALVLYLDCRLTKNSYILMRKRANDAGYIILYPSYHKLQ